MSETRSILEPLGTGEGHLKAGFLGFPKAGKTYTATLLAIGVREFFKLEGPIAFFDTEKGSGYVAPLVKERTGTDLIGVRSRSLKDLLATTRACITEKVSVLIADSVTHPWRELCESYLAQLNERRRAANQRPLQKLEFQHWGALKQIWAEWTDLYINAPLHIIIAGRAGYEYAMEENDETGRKELQKTGVRMKTEGEFGFEPSLLVEMERIQEPNGRGGFDMIRRATVLGDRFGKIDARTMDNPTFEFFLPHVQMLRAGAHTTVDTSSATETGADESGDTEWNRERRARTIFAEEIKGELESAGKSGQSAADKKERGDLLHEIFGTRSWTAIENLHSQRLRTGLDKLRVRLGTAPPDLPDEGEQKSADTEGTT